MRIAFPRPLSDPRRTLDPVTANLAGTTLHRAPVPPFSIPAQANALSYSPPSRRSTSGDLVAVQKFINHSRLAVTIASRHGWLPGARYTNLRDARTVDQLGLLDIDWKRYDFPRHLDAAKATRPLLTVARDIVDHRDLKSVIRQAEQLRAYAEAVIIVPKDPALRGRLRQTIPSCFRLGFSVATSYGSTDLGPADFAHGAEVHLLGGRPDIQRKLADTMNVVSLDCNRFTLDARYGKYFDGGGFRLHPEGGYERCMEDSVRSINAIWSGYKGVRNDT